MALFLQIGSSYPLLFFFIRTQFFNALGIDVDLSKPLKCPSTLEGQNVTEQRRFRAKDAERPAAEAFGEDHNDRYDVKTGSQSPDDFLEGLKKKSRAVESTPLLEAESSLSPDNTFGDSSAHLEYSEGPFTALNDKEAINSSAVLPGSAAQERGKSRGREAADDTPGKHPSFANGEAEQNTQLWQQQWRRREYTKRLSLSLSVNVVLAAVGTLVAIFFPNPGTVLGYVGAVTGIAYIFTLPVLVDYAVELRKRKVLMGNLPSFHSDEGADSALARASSGNPEVQTVPKTPEIARPRWRPPVLRFVLNAVVAVVGCTAVLLQFMVD